MTNPNRKPIKFCSLGGYVPFCDRWWADLSWWFTGFHWNTSYRELGFWKQFSLGRPGWAADIHNYWCRARYGWAPRDTWSLDHYLNNVLAGSLWHLADNKNGTPAGYPTIGGKPQEEMTDDEWETHHEMWIADLKRWSTAFREAADGCDIYDAADGYVRHNAEEKRIRENLNLALKELIVWWEALWS